MRTPAELEEADAKRTAELNERLGVCSECGKWALKHHAHCSRAGELVDAAKQQACMAYGRGERR